MSRSDGDRPSVQNKRHPDLDWESGWSKKQLVTDHRSEQDEQVPEPTPQPRAEKPSFKAVGHIVMAMKRFQASLNPTYTYGKVADTTSSGSSGFIHPAQRVMKKSDSMNSDGNNNKKSLSSRGNRTALLFKQLADVPQNS